MKHMGFGKIYKRIISIMLAVALLSGSFSSTSYAAVTISHSEKSTSLDLLMEVASANLAVYGMQTTKENVKKALLAAGYEHDLLLISEDERESFEASLTGWITVDSDTEEDSEIPPAKVDQITSVTINDIINKLVDQYNTANGWDIATKEPLQITDPETGKVSQGSTTAKYVTFDAAKGLSYAGSVLTTGYTYGGMMVEYVREKDPSVRVMYNDDILSAIKEKVTTDTPDASMSDILSAVHEQAQLVRDTYSSGTDKDYITEFLGKHAVTYFEYTDGGVDESKVPAGTLFIGTFLIDAQTVNDVYYRYAKDSMGMANQPIMYYKSELDEGHWKDIVSAVGLTDILPASANVETADLMRRNITCVIGSDGIPRYPDDGTEADIFTMSNPYDMAQVPELLPLKTLLDSGAVSQNTSDISNRYAADALFRFFNYDGCGDNDSMMIIRNKAYRDYLYDHSDAETIKKTTGPNPIKRAVPVNITQEEMDYIVSMTTQQLKLECNMPQCEDKYAGHGDAFYDQILAWAEYYGNDKFKINNTYGGNVSHPYIFPIEDMAASEWELDNRRADWKNPQSYMIIINGKIGTDDQKAFVDRWLKDSTYLAPDNITYTMSGQFAANHGDNINDMFYAYTGLNYWGGDTSTKFELGSKWNEFSIMIYHFMDWMRNMYDIRDEETDKTDQTLRELNALYRQKRDIANTVDEEEEGEDEESEEAKAARAARATARENAKNEADTLMRLMSRVDATRRARIYYNLVYNEKNNYIVGPTLPYLLNLLENGIGP
nr:hypothetical protein [Lachnospiraceae bacterium]